MQRRKRIVLYYPRSAHPTREDPASKDLLPLSLLAIAAWPDRDGYEVVVVDGNLHEPEDAWRRVVELADGALLFGTTGILSYQVADAFHCSQRVKAAHPRLPLFIGGWWASVAPELELATGLYDAVCIGQGELTFREIVQAVDAGEPLDRIAGLALLCDGEVVRTAPRPVVGWDQLLDCPWHLLDIEPYRAAQLAGRPGHEAGRLLAPPGHADRPYFGISYYASFGCPEPCTFCCSPEMSGMRWKAMPAERMLDDLCALKERWGFDRVRFYDANFGVAEKRARAFAEGLVERGADFWWYAFMQAASIVRYRPDTLDLLADSGLYLVLIGGETGDADTLRSVGKRTPDGANVRATDAITSRGIQALVSYIIGYPGETAGSMLETIEECRRVAALSERARPAVWPFRPIPGTALYAPSLAQGFAAPADPVGWGEFSEYHDVGEAWPGQIPPEVRRARKLFEHYATLSLGLARGRIGFWERRARARIRRGDFRLARLEAKAFDLWMRHGPGRAAGATAGSA